MPLQTKNCDFVKRKGILKDIASAFCKSPGFSRDELDSNFQAALKDVGNKHFWYHWKEHLIGFYPEDSAMVNVV